jgi:hypothetical protein
MTSDLYVTGTHVASVERTRLPDGEDENGVGSTAHAASWPVVDGLAASVSGMLVIAITAMDWADARAVPRCQECRRIAG